MSLIRLVEDDAMTILQAICFGAMLAWTPSLIIMAWVLYEAPLEEIEDLKRSPA